VASIILPPPRDFLEVTNHVPARGQRYEWFSGSTARKKF
jgi:hypothetical protein